MADLHATMEGLTVSSISRRGARTASSDDFLMKYMAKAEANRYLADSNPQGIINMGTAVNRLMEQELQHRLGREDVMHFSSEKHQHYFDFGGTDRLRSALSDFFSRHFTGGKKIPQEQLIVMNGVTSCLDSLAFGCCDEGDVMITPTPVYGRIFTDFQERSYVDVQPLQLLSQNCGAGEEFQLTGDMLEQRIQELRALGKTVKAFVLVNPQNPLGCIYGEPLVMALLRVCAKYKVHAIVDEIYALSLHSQTTQFQSVLSFDSLPDPTRTHFLWGMSKDFGLAGIRVGVIRTTNPELLRYLSIACTYQVTASIVHDAVATLLLDREWCDEFFLPLNRERLGDCYRRAVDQLTAGGLRVFPGQAALFAWIDVSAFLHQQTHKEELAVFEEALAAGVYVVPGQALHTKDPGWLRMVVSVSDLEQRVGIERLLAVLHRRLKPKHDN